MRIDSSGNVGIGTDSPYKELDIKNTSSDPYIHVGEGDNSNVLALGYDISANVGLIQSWAGSASDFIYQRSRR